VEGTSETELKYYFAGTIRIALREDEAITWLLSDHLGSTSVTVDAVGGLLTSLKYAAFGELRTGTSTTDYQYTGQRNEMEIGLYFYVSRFYDPQLARFISADTIVPEAGNAKAYDRYMYVNGNPINFNDPSGHKLWDGITGDTGTGGDYKSFAYSVYYELHTEQERQENQQTLEKVVDVTTSIIGVLNEPVDWAITAAYCASGDCSPWAFAGLFPFIPSSIAKHLDDVPWKTIIDPKYWDLVEGAFKSEPSVVELTTDLKVLRYYGGNTIPTNSPWFSIKSYSRFGNARRFLSLPNRNLATNVAEFSIPKGARILIGNAASKVNDVLIFGKYAVGGGVQIYLPDPTMARWVK
jgi:RHS repeat-associated protein